MPAFRTRFAFVYFVLFFFPFPVPLLVPLAAVASRRIGDQVGAWIAGITGATIPITHHAGDSLLQFVLWAAAAATAIVSAVAWQAIELRRSGHQMRDTAPSLDAWLRAYLRLVLGYALIADGAAKAIPAQFPALPLDRLLQPIGDTSPMGLLWAFMGGSYLYNVVTGLAEIAAGVLVMRRATSLLGVLVALPIIVNVVALNFGYDVPMKLFSLHLLAVAVFLLWPDVPRLADVIAGRTAGAPPLPRPLFADPKRNRAARLAGGAFIAFAVVTTLIDADATRRDTGDLAPPLPMHGVWQVAEFLVDGMPAAPAARWRRLVFDRGESCGLQLADETYVRLLLRLDAASPTLVMTTADDAGFAAPLASVAYEMPLPDTLLLTGTLRERPLRVRLSRLPLRPFLLRDRGFHWVNESAFNR